ncbi:MAG: ankyrin repeat domain-containing protein [Chlorobi bacterium]|nr:ankyrin repeat domain-containing protein [Chlorobiota bacterium]
MINIFKIYIIAFFTFACLGLFGQNHNLLVLPDTSYVVINPGLELLIAASEGDTLKASALLEMGTDVNYSNNDGVSALMFAAEAGHLPMVEMLLHRGAKVNYPPNNQIDALLGACIGGHVYVADTLIQNGANVNTENKNGITPLMYAAAYNDTILADMLLFYGANPEIKDNEGNTALMVAVFYGNSEIVALLSDHGAKTTKRDREGFTPLMAAAQNGHLDEVGFLLEKGADVGKQTNHNLTALSVAIINRQTYVAGLLLENGANPNHQISKVQNQFSLARKYHAKEIKTLLLENGAKRNYRPVFENVNIGIDITSAKSDFMMGVEAGLSETKYNLLLRLGIKARPYTRSVLYPINDKVSYQLWEKRAVVNLGIDKQIVLGHLSLQSYGGLFGGLDYVYTYGSFRGSNKKPDDGFYWIPRVGLFWNFERILLSANYEYFPLKNSRSSPHRYNFSLRWKFNFERNMIRLKGEPKL